MDRFLHALTAEAEDSGYHVLLFAERPRGAGPRSTYGELLVRKRWTASCCPIRRR